MAAMAAMAKMATMASSPGSQSDVLAPAKSNKIKLVNTMTEGNRHKLTVQ